MKNLIRSERGFSLIELMIVVAIIGILSAVAIPNFQRFQRKAKQSEAKSLLSALYTAEKAYQAEYDSYFGMFRNIGFAAEGTLKYDVGFAAVGVAKPASDTSATGTHFNTEGWCAGDGAGACTQAPATFAAAVAGGAAPCNVAGTDPTATTFTASAVGGIRAGTAATAIDDQWTMNHNKTLCNTMNGAN